MMGVKAWWRDQKRRPGVKRFLRFIRPHRISAFQLTVTFVLANLPIIISYLVKVLTADPTKNIAYWNVFLDLFKGGDIYVYSAALVAPFGWTVLEYIRKQRAIWLAPFPISLAFLCSVVGSVIYALSEGGLYSKPLISALATSIFIASVVVLYWSVYSDRALTEPSIEEPFEKEEDDINTILAEMNEAK